VKKNKFRLVLLILMYGGFVYSQAPGSGKVDAPPVQGSANPSGISKPMDSPPDLAGANPIANDVYIYDPTGKRDPFRPEDDKEVISDDGGKRRSGPAPLAPRELEPLEAFDVSQIKVLAIIWDVKNPRALVKDPNGQTHLLKLKSRIGKKNGFVVAIREGEIVVVEYDAEIDQWVKSFKVLELR